MSKSYCLLLFAFGLTISVSLFSSCNKKQASAPTPENAKSENIKVSKEGEVISLTTDDFIERVADFRSSPDQFKFKGTRPAVVDFYTTWCVPCKHMAVTFDKAAAKYKGKVDFYRVDIESESELADFMGITSIPTILYIPTKGKPNINVGLVEETEFDAKIMELLK